MAKNRNQAEWPVIFATLCIAALLLSGCSGGEDGPPPTLTPVPLARHDGKQALFVLGDRFSASEYYVPRSILEGLGVDITVGSWSLEEVLGSTGELVKPEVRLAEVQAGDFDAIVFVGGYGVLASAPETERVVAEAVAEDRVVAGICAARAILRNAGLWQGEAADGVYIGTESRVVAARGPLNSQAFGEAIAVVMAQ
jgi:putative intracellular protease/amidase